MDSLITFIEKLPNWLRYILAIPFGILAYIVISFIILLGQSLFNDANSIWLTLISFIISNGISIIIFLNAVYFMVPNNKYKFTLVLAIFIEIFCTILTFNVFTIANITLGTMLAYILFTICLVLSLCFLHNQSSSEELQEVNKIE